MEWRGGGGEREGGLDAEVLVSGFWLPDPLGAGSVFECLDEGGECSSGFVELFEALRLGVGREEFLVACNTDERADFEE